MATSDLIAVLLIIVFVLAAILAGLLILVFVLIALSSEQPEIVRCKDCKHSEHWYRDKRRCFLWVEDGIDVFDDGFCNYAER